MKEVLATDKILTAPAHGGTIAWLQSQRRAEKIPQAQV